MQEVHGVMEDLNGGEVHGAMVVQQGGTEDLGLSFG